MLKAMAVVGVKTILCGCDRIFQLYGSTDELTVDCVWAASDVWSADTAKQFLFLRFEFDLKVTRTFGASGDQDYTLGS